MCIKKYVHLIGTLAVLCSIVVPSSCAVHASHINRLHIVRYYHLSAHHHWRISRHYRHIRAIKRHREHLIHKLARQGSPFNNTIRQRLIYDVNKARRLYGVHHLKVIPISQATADYRIPYVQYAYTHQNESKNYRGKNFGDWIHGMDLHVSYSDFLARHHVYRYYGGENACDFQVGFEEQSDLTNPPYNNNTPKGIADNIDDDFMNHDVADGNHNGHRYNELNPHYRYIGIGVRYDTQTNYGQIVEDFIS